MLNFACIPSRDAPIETGGGQLIAAELRSLIARIEVSMRLLDAAMTQEDMTQDDIAREDDSAIAGSTEIFVLDDVAPRYAMAIAALDASRAGLDHTLQQLSESGNPA